MNRFFNLNAVFSFIFILFIITNSVSNARTLKIVTTEDVVAGSGIIKSEIREAPFFNTVSLRGDYDVTIICEKKRKSKIKITGDDNILPHIITKVEGKKLFTYLNKPVNIKTSIKIKVFTNTLAEFFASGKNNIIVSNIQNKKFALDIKGAGNISVSGKTEEFTVVLSGRVKLDAGSFISEICRITTRGNGDVTVFASEKLEGKIRGIGKIGYYGNPGEIRKDISGLGQIVKIQIK